METTLKLGQHSAEVQGTLEGGGGTGKARLVPAAGCSPQLRGFFLLYFAQGPLGPSQGESPSLRYRSIFCSPPGTVSAH